MLNPHHCAVMRFCTRAFLQMAAAEKGKILPRERSQPDAHGDAEFEKKRWRPSSSNSRSQLPDASVSAPAAAAAASGSAVTSTPLQPVVLKRGQSDNTNKGKMDMTVIPRRKKKACLFDASAHAPYKDELTKELVCLGFPGTGDPSGHAVTILVCPQPHSKATTQLVIEAELLHAQASFDDAEVVLLFTWDGRKRALSRWVACPKWKLMLSYSDTQYDSKFRTEMLKTHETRYGGSNDDGDGDDDSLETLQQAMCFHRQTVFVAPFNSASFQSLVVE